MLRPMLSSIAKAYREAFSGLPRPVWLLSIATLVNRSGTMVLPFLALYLTEKRGFSTTGAGQVLAVYGIGGVAGSYLGGWLGDHLDPRRVMVASLALTGGGFLLLGALTSHAAILASVVFLSLVGESFRPANSAALGAASPPEARTKAYALYRLAINLGMTLGPAAGGFLAARDYAWLFRADAATCLLAAVVLWASFRQELKPLGRAAMSGGAAGEAGAGERSPWQDRPFLALAGLMFLLAVVTFQVMSTFPLTLRHVNRFSERQIGLSLAVNTLVIVLFEMVLIHRLGGREPLKVAAAGSLLFCTGLGLLPLGKGFAYVAFTILVWTIGEMLTFPVLAGVVANRAGEANRGRYMGIYSLAAEGAFVFAPLAGTWIFQRFGAVVLWGGCGAVGLLLFAGFWRLAGVFAREKRAERLSRVA